MSFKHQNIKKSTMKKMTVAFGGASNVKCSTEELAEVLKKVSFDLININLSLKKSYTDSSNAKGYASVGFVNSFNAENNTFDVVVFENRVETIEELGEVVVSARVFTNKEGKITKVIGLDIEPVHA